MAIGAAIQLKKALVAAKNHQQVLVLNPRLPEAIVAFPSAAGISVNQDAKHLDALIPHFLCVGGISIAFAHPSR